MNLKFCLWNVENLFLLSDEKFKAEHLKVDEAQWQKLSVSVHSNKSLRKCREIAKVLHEIDADIVMLCEVGGQESLTNFNELFLKDLDYAAALIEGNSNRNIDIGYLVKRSQQYYFDLASNKNRSIEFLYAKNRHLGMAASEKFSRDVAELKLFAKDREDPFLIILLAHLKSHLDPEGIDHGGVERRTAELKALVDIHLELQKKYPKAPQIVAGDFNGNASRIHTEKEFLDIYDRTQLEDVLHVAGVEPTKRVTHTQIRTNQRADSKQIDFCFLSSPLQCHIKENTAKVRRFCDEFGFELDLPQTLDAKLNLASDHYPIIFELENLLIW